jgi:hypothetical protein
MKTTINLNMLELFVATTVLPHELAEGAHIVGTRIYATAEAAMYETRRAAEHWVEHVAKVNVTGAVFRIEHDDDGTKIFVGERLIRTYGIESLFIKE